MMTQSNLTFIEGHEITEGYKKTEVGVIPVDWELIKLAEIAEVKMCKRVLSAQTKKNDVIPFFKIGTFGGEPDTYISKSLYDEFRAKYSFPEKGDILISAAGTLGKTVIYDGKESYFQDSNIVWLKVDKKKISNEYLYHYYKVIQWAATEGTTIARLYNGIIYDTQILLPPINEQKIVAEALSDTDALISELEKLIEKKQAIKTATMQQLLTGKTRLPEFALREDGTAKGYKDSELGKISEDWEIFNLPNVIWYQEGPGLRKWQFQSKGLKVINVTNLQESGYLDLDKTSRHISWDEFEKMYKHFACDEGDMVIASSGNSYCKTSIVRSVDLPLLMNTSVIRFKPLKNFSQAFMYVYLSSKFFKSQIDLLITGGAQPNFGPAHLEKIKIIAPNNYSEQNQIGEILLDLDHEIKALEIKLSKIKSIKQGMMQELLTGKTRLV